jgi:hypothetical protein
MAHEAVDKIAPTMPEDLDVDPASRLFFEFAAPLLLTAETDEQFRTASAIAEFVWATTHFDSASQVLMIDEFIQDAGIPPEMVPWLLDVYTELAARKEALLGE